MIKKIFSCLLRSSTFFAGFRPIMVVIAILMNLGLFYGINNYYIYTIKHSYSSQLLNPKLDFQVWQDNEETYLWEDKNIKNWLSSIVSFSYVRPFRASAVINEMLETVEFSSAKSQMQLIDRYVQGNLSWTLLGYVNSEYTSGEEVFEIMASTKENRWNKIFYSDPFAEQKKMFITHCIQIAVNEQYDNIRALRRWNGIIQWLIVFIAWILIIHLLYRFIHLSRSRNALEKNNTQKALKVLERLTSEYKFIDNVFVNLKKDMSLEETKNKFKDLDYVIRTKVYMSYHFFLSTLPSLGFIGTVLGMGEALLKSNLLFAAHNRQEQQTAVNEITQQLGFAFDTTLVALIASIIVGLVMVIVEKKEYLLIKQIDHHVCKGE